MNADHDPQKKLLFGTSGCGKSTLFRTLIQAGGYRWRYVFDWDLKVSRELGWTAATTVEGLCQLQDAGRPVVFYPRRMFPDLEEGFGFFCRFVLLQAEGRQGKKLFCSDELQEFVSYGTKLQPAFREMLNYGRNEEIDLVLAAQRVNGLPTRVTAQVTEIYVFKHSDLDGSALDRLAEIGIDPEQVKLLPHPSVHGKVGWIYRHCLTGQQKTIIHAINR